MIRLRNRPLIKTWILSALAILALNCVSFASIKVDQDDSFLADSGTIADLDGDHKPDLVVNLLDYKRLDNPHPDEHPLLNPATLKWQGMHETFTRLANDSFQDATRVYRALWKKGLTDTELNDLAIAASTWEQYDHGYWLKENIFRLLDKRLAGDKTLQSRLRQSYFTGDTDAMIKVIDSLDPMPQR